MSIICSYITLEDARSLFLSSTAMLRHNASEANWKALVLRHLSDRGVQFWMMDDIWKQLPLLQMGEPSLLGWRCERTSITLRRCKMV